MTINCAERGLLLLRVRDEIQMTIAAYQTLYESSVAFGMRKALQAEQGKADMEKHVRIFFIFVTHAPKNQNGEISFVPHLKAIDCTVADCFSVRHPAESTISLQELL